MKFQLMRSPDACENYCTRFRVEIPESIGRETYVVLCAKGDIDAGVEIRVDYNFGSQGVGTFHHYLTANCGVPKHELASRIFREAVWRRPR